MKPRTRLLGIDYGTVRVGLAISDPQRRVASPLGVYTRGSQSEDAGFFRELIEEEEVGGLVMGLPLHFDGRVSEMAQQAIDYAEWLQKLTGLAVMYADERFSTVEAENELQGAKLTNKKRKQRRDTVSATITLQAHLDAGCPTEMPRYGLNDPGEVCD